MKPSELLATPISCGQKVFTTVSRGGEVVRMASGIVVGVHSGYCDVDVMSLHGGAPWIQQHSNSSLELCEDSPEVLAKLRECGL